VEGIAARDYPEELPVGYYLDNFQTILDFVDSHTATFWVQTKKASPGRFAPCAWMPGVCTYA